MKNKNQKADKSILLVTYIIVAVFSCMCGYFIWFLQFKSETVINNSYNARLDRFSDRIIRGKILGNDGTVLAETVVDEFGNETRSYPFGPVFSHAVGFSSKGKSGLESLANFYLLSSHVNLIEQVVNELSDIKNLGDNCYTTLDPELQQAAYDALGDRRGAVVVLEPDTGKVLAMVSKPSFDPNQVDEEWEGLTSGENTQAQLLNRAAQGLYPPGSVFKIVTALQYIREHPDDYQNFQFDCTGFFQLNGYTIKCYHETAHGPQNLELAFANSCNGAFSSMGLNMNLAGWKSAADQLLFNQEQPLAVPYSKSSYSMSEGADQWEILQTSIGQGVTQTTPMHIAMITAAAANGGILMKPYFIEHVENVGGETIKKFMPEAYGPIMSAKESELLTGLMRSVVTVGTGSGVSTDQYTVAGKTGSAEFETGKETHAWFTGFAPVEDPQILVTVLIEEGGSGGKVAAPAARAIFDTYFGTY